MTDWFCYVDEDKYGPIDTPTLKRWVREGRISRSSRVWHEGMEQWTSAGQVPDLSSEFPGDSGKKPERGGLLLVLAIGGIVVCPLLSLAALLMSHWDLKEMDEGMRDPKGRRQTRLARIIALLPILSLLAVVVGMVLMSLLGVDVMGFRGRP